MKDDDEKREEVRRIPYFVSLWMACRLLRKKTVKEEQGWEEGEFRVCQVGSTCGTSRWRCPVDSSVLGPEPQERLCS